ncbi:MAG TPA: sugar phosphate nucleotidyltransferase [Verrucomicrobiae bacterium]|nr:sugar phosphate nucleotidyltransferase [Verrucomicrobiae bacterium]
MKPVHPQDRCGIVLAGSKDNRLGAFIHYLKGSAAPKQFVNFIGRRSMLEHTLDRAERLVRRGCLYTVATREHLAYPEVQRQLAGRPRDTVIVQPNDLDSGPAIMLPLARIHKRRPETAVAVFPADHFILEEELFMTQVGMALYMVERSPTDVFLLGVEPDAPEADYGYIVTDGEADELAPSGARNVRLLVEKPDAALAHELAVASGLWNTMTIVFRADTAVHLIRRFAPQLYQAFCDIEAALGTRAEPQAIERAYRRLQPLCFNDVLHKCAALRPARIRVLPVSGVFWSDWGSEARIADSLKQTGYFDRLKKTADTGVPLG